MASHGSRPGGGNKKRKRSSFNNGDNNCICCSAEVGFSRRWHWQQERVLANNNSGSNNLITVGNGSSAQSHHSAANNDFFLPDQHSELDVDMIINEEGQAESYRRQMLLAGDGENGIHNDNMNVPSNQVAAHNYHQPLTPAQIFRVENNTIEEQNTNMLLDDPERQGPSSFLGPLFSYYDNNVVDELASVNSFSMMEPIIQSSSQQYEPQSQSYGDLFQQQAPSSSSGAMNHRQHQRQNDATNMQAHSSPNNHLHGPSSSIFNNAGDVEVELLPHKDMFVLHNNRNQ